MEDLKILHSLRENLNNLIVSKEKEIPIQDLYPGNKKLFFERLIENQSDIQLDIIHSLIPNFDFEDFKYLDNTRKIWFLTNICQRLQGQIYTKEISPVERIKQTLLDRIPSMKERDRVFDLTYWNPIDKTGCRTNPMPAPLTKSTKWYITEYPVVSLDSEKFVPFLEFLGLSFDKNITPLKCSERKEEIPPQSSLSPLPLPIPSQLPVEETSFCPHSNQQKLLNRFPDLMVNNKFIDISNWNFEEERGYRIISFPPPGSEKWYIAEYPIVSSCPGMFSQFLEFLELPIKGKLIPLRCS